MYKFSISMDSLDIFDCTMMKKVILNESIIFILWPLTLRHLVIEYEIQSHKRIHGKITLNRTK